MPPENRAIMDLFLTTEQDLHKQMRTVLFKVVTLGRHTLIHTVANISGTLTVF